MDTQSSNQNLIRFGGRLRRLKMEEVLETEKDDSEDIEETAEGEEEWQWTPETICKRMEGLTRFGHKLLTRSNWYPRLANSMIYWDQRQGRNSSGITLKDAVIIKNVQTSEPHFSDMVVSTRQSIQKTKHQFDIFDYDRMRVLTTEIKRLVKENRNPLIRLDATRIMDSHHLSLILPWV